MNNKKDKEGKVYYNGCNKIQCIDCFRISRLGSNGQSEISTSVQKPINEMIRELNRDFGIQIDPSASTVETMDIYETYISSSNNNRNEHLNNVAMKVKFPVHNTNYFDDIDVMGSYNFKDGGRFINDKQIIEEVDLIAVFKFISSCLDHNEKNLVHCNSSDVGHYSHLPTFLLNFAYQSRVDSGYRLLDRCARHVCDPKTMPLDESSFDLFKYNGKFKQIS
jgi:hypothetical protein